MWPQMAPMSVTFNDLEGHLPVAGLFRCNLANICAAFYTISTDTDIVSSASCDTIPAVKDGRTDTR